MNGNRLTEEQYTLSLAQMLLKISKLQAQHGFVCSLNRQVAITSKHVDTTCLAGTPFPTRDLSSSAA